MSIWSENRPRGDRLSGRRSQRSQTNAAEIDGVRQFRVEILPIQASAEAEFVVDLYRDDACSIFRDIQDRMPVIRDPSAFQAWLDRNTRAASLCKHCSNPVTVLR
jgi:hypothetical protein